MSSVRAAAILPDLMAASMATQTAAASQMANIGSQNPHAALPSRAASRSRASVAKQPSTTPASPLASEKRGGNHPAPANRMAMATLAASNVGCAERLLAVPFDSGNAQAASMPSAATVKPVRCAIAVMDAPPCAVLPSARSIRPDR